MKKLLILLMMFAMLVCSCSTGKQIASEVTTRQEVKEETRTEIKKVADPDSALIRALFECDENNKLLITALDSMQGGAAQTPFGILSSVHPSSQELAHDLFFVKLNTRKRILIYPLVGKCYVDNLLQALHIADNGILLTIFLGLQIELKCSHKFAVYLGDRQILFVVFQFDKFGKIACTTFVTSYGDYGKIFTHQRSTLLVMFTHSSDDGAYLLHLFVHPEELFLQYSGSDKFPILFELRVNSVEFDATLLNVVIKLGGFTTFSPCTLLCLIPRHRLNTFADVCFDSCAIDCDTHTY